MTQFVAAMIALTLVLGALVASFVLLWTIASQIARKCRCDHVRALREKARRLETAGYFEAAEQFRDYAEAIEAGPAKQDAQA